MILDHSVFAGIADMHDRHRDMRLDVDNMSYEVNKHLFQTTPVCRLVPLLMRDCYCVTLLNVIGATCFGRTHWKCEHWVE